MSSVWPTTSSCCTACSRSTPSSLSGSPRRSTRSRVADALPAESERLLRRITGRDRWFLAVLALLTVVGTVGAALLLPHGSRPSTDADCVTMLRASIMGGATYKFCGAKAVAACLGFANGDKVLAARCEELASTRRR